MSIRRSLSFASDEMELLNYFDENGKSDIAKEAMKFYRENKDKVITTGMIELLKSLNISESSKQNKLEFHNKLSQYKK